MALSRKCCSYKVIFMDLNMPVMDGFDSARLIKEHYVSTDDEKNSPWIVAVSAMSHQSKIQKCFDVGMN